MTTTNFTAAAKEAERAEEDPLDEDLIEFWFDGEGSLVADRPDPKKHTGPYYTYPPTPTQLGLFSASMAGDVMMHEVMGEMLVLIRHIFHPDTYQILYDRMYDRKDPIELESINEVLEWLVEELTDRPTPLSSASTSQRRTGGQKLTGHLPPKAQTRSRSPRAASAT